MTPVQTHLENPKSHLATRAAAQEGRHKEDLRPHADQHQQQLHYVHPYQQPGRRDAGWMIPQEENKNSDTPQRSKRPRRMGPGC